MSQVDPQPSQARSNLTYRWKFNQVGKEAGRLNRRSRRSDQPRLCKHHIIANSSFSWWGAWLNRNAEKIVIAPKQWFSGDMNDVDLVPSNWLKL